MGEGVGNLSIDGGRPIKDLKVAELRQALEKRGLAINGNKRELIQRLSIYEENRQKSSTGRLSQETPNQWLEKESDSDFLREYFASQKALYQEQVERRNQIGVKGTPQQDSTVSQRAAISHKAPVAPIVSSQPGSSQNYAKTSVSETHHQSTSNYAPPIVAHTPKKRGRKPKVRTQVPEDVAPLSPMLSAEQPRSPSPPVSRPSRRSSAQTARAVNCVSFQDEDSNDAVFPSTRDEVIPTGDTEYQVNTSRSPQKRGRGRPPKRQVIQEDIISRVPTSVHIKPVVEIEPTILPLEDNVTRRKDLTVVKSLNTSSQQQNKVPCLKIKIPETVPKTSTSSVSPVKEVFLNKLRIMQDDYSNSNISKLKNACPSPQNAEVSSSVQEEGNISLSCSKPVDSELPADSTSSSSSVCSSSSTSENEAVCSSGEDKSDVESEAEKWVQPPLKLPSKAVLLQVAKEKLPVKIEKNPSKKIVVPKAEVSLTRLDKEQINVTTIPDNSTFKSETKLSEINPQKLQTSTTSSTIIKRAKKVNVESPCKKDSSESYCIESKIKKDLVNLRLSDDETPIKELSSAKTPTLLVKELSVSKKEPSRRSSRLTKTVPVQTKKEVLKVQPVKSGSPQILKDVKISCAKFTPKSDVKLPPSSHHFIESLKQQIQMPLHMEKFPNSDSKSEVSSTSELIESSKPIKQFKEVSPRFRSFPRETPILDAHIAVEGHLDTAMVPDSGSVDSSTSAETSVDIKGKDFAVAPDLKYKNQGVPKVRPPELKSPPKATAYMIKNLIESDKNVIATSQTNIMDKVVSKPSQATIQNLPKVKSLKDSDKIKVHRKDSPTSVIKSTCDIQSKIDPVVSVSEASATVDCVDERKKLQDNLHKPVQNIAPENIFEPKIDTSMFNDILKEAALAADIEEHLEDYETAPHDFSKVEKFEEITVSMKDNSNVETDTSILKNMSVTSDIKGSRKTLNEIGGTIVKEQGISVIKETKNIKKLVTNQSKVPTFEISKSENRTISEIQFSTKPDNEKVIEPQCNLSFEKKSGDASKFEIASLRGEDSKAINKDENKIQTFKIKEKASTQKLLKKDVTLPVEDKLILVKPGLSETKFDATLGKKEVLKKSSKDVTEKVILSEIKSNQEALSKEKNDSDSEKKTETCSTLNKLSTTEPISKEKIAEKQIGQLPMPSLKEKVPKIIEGILTQKHTTQISLQESKPLSNEVKNVPIKNIAVKQSDVLVTSKGETSVKKERPVLKTSKEEIPVRKETLVLKTSKETSVRIDKPVLKTLMNVTSSDAISSFKVEDVSKSALVKKVDVDIIKSLGKKELKDKELLPTNESSKESSTKDDKPKKMAPIDNSSLLKAKEPLKEECIQSTQKDKTKSSVVKEVILPLKKAVVPEKLLDKHFSKDAKQDFTQNLRKDTSMESKESKELKFTPKVLSVQSKQISLSLKECNVESSLTSKQTLTKIDSSAPLQKDSEFKDKSKDVHIQTALHDKFESTSKGALKETPKHSKLEPACLKDSPVNLSENVLISPKGSIKDIKHIQQKELPTSISKTESLLDNTGDVFIKDVKQTSEEDKKLNLIAMPKKLETSKGPTLEKSPKVDSLSKVSKDSKTDLVPSKEINLKEPSLKQLKSELPSCLKSVINIDKSSSNFNEKESKPDSLKTSLNKKISLLTSPKGLSKDVKEETSISFTTSSPEKMEMSKSLFKDSKTGVIFLHTEKSPSKTFEKSKEASVLSLIKTPVVLKPGKKVEAEKPIEISPKMSSGIKPDLIKSSKSCEIVEAEQPVVISPKKSSVIKLNLIKSPKSDEKVEAEKPVEISPKEASGIKLDLIKSPKSGQQVEAEKPVEISHKKTSDIKPNLIKSPKSGEKVEGEKLVEISPKEASGIKLDLIKSPKSGQQVEAEKPVEISHKKTSDIKPNLIKSPRSGEKVEAVKLVEILPKETSGIKLHLIKSPKSGQKVEAEKPVEILPKMMSDIKPNLIKSPIHESKSDIKPVDIFEDIATKEAKSVHTVLTKKEGLKHHETTSQSLGSVIAMQKDVDIKKKIIPKYDKNYDLKGVDILGEQSISKDNSYKSVSALVLDSKLDSENVLNVESDSKEKSLEVTPVAEVSDKVKPDQKCDNISIKSEVLSKNTSIENPIPEVLTLDKPHLKKDIDPSKESLNLDKNTEKETLSIPILSTELQDRKKIIITKEIRLLPAEHVLSVKERTVFEQVAHKKEIILPIQDCPTKDNKSNKIVKEQILPLSAKTVSSKASLSRDGETCEEKSFKRLKTQHECSDGTVSKSEAMQSIHLQQQVLSKDKIKSKVLNIPLPFHKPKIQTSIPFQKKIEFKLSDIKLPVGTTKRPTFFVRFEKSIALGTKAGETTKIESLTVDNKEIESPQKIQTRNKETENKEKEIENKNKESENKQKEIEQEKINILVKNIVSLALEKTKEQTIQKQTDPISEDKSIPTSKKEFLKKVSQSEEKTKIALFGAAYKSKSDEKVEAEKPVEISFKKKSDIKPESSTKSNFNLNLIPLPVNTGAHSSDIVFPLKDCPEETEIDKMARRRKADSAAADDSAENGEVKEYSGMVTRRRSRSRSVDVEIPSVEKKAAKTPRRSMRGEEKRKKKQEEKSEEKEEEEEEEEEKNGEKLDAIDEEAENGEDKVVSPVKEKRRSKSKSLRRSRSASRSRSPKSRSHRERRSHHKRHHKERRESPESSHARRENRRKKEKSSEISKKGIEVKEVVEKQKDNVEMVEEKQEKVSNVNEKVEEAASVVEERKEKASVRDNEKEGEKDLEKSQSKTEEKEELEKMENEKEEVKPEAEEDMEGGGEIELRLNDSEADLDAEVHPEEAKVKETKEDVKPFKSARKVSLCRSRSGEDDQSDRPKKRRWGGANKDAQALEISSTSLKCLIPDVKPLSPGEVTLQLKSEDTSPSPSEDETDIENIELPERTVREQEEDEEKRNLRKVYEVMGKEELEEEKKEKRDEDREEEEEKDGSESPESRTVKSQRLKILGLVHSGPEAPSAPSSSKSTSQPSRGTRIGGARNPVSRVIYVTNLVRPFTVKQLRSLLLRTGVISENGFWIDAIKSMCLVMYENDDQALETRMALHGVKWPSVNPKNLFVDFATEADMRKKISEAPSAPSLHSSQKSSSASHDDGRKERRRAEGPVREWDLAKLGERSPGEREREKERAHKEREEERMREREQTVRDEHSPKRQEKAPLKKASAVKSLDDLFKKTTAQPAIYWLPLDTKQIGEKEALRRQRIDETERRLAEMKVEKQKEKEEREERQKVERRRREERRAAAVAAAAANASRRSRSRSQRRRSRRSPPRGSRRRSSSRDARKDRRRSSSSSASHS